MRQYRSVTIGIIAAVVILSGAVYYMTRSQAGQERAARAVVDSFGQQLKNVSLSGTNDIAVDAITRYYADYVTPELLASWKASPVTAPGRRTSSPWPERIDVKDVSPQGAGYIVNGDEVFMTSAEVTKGGESHRVPIIALVVKTDSGWRIASYQNQLRP